MDETELMKKYERETRKKSEKYIMVHVSVDGYDHGEFVHDEEYVAWLEAKAASYDRLMSGEYTLKDMANIFQMYSAIDADGYARLFADPPFIDRVGWSSNFPEEEFSIPGGVKHTGDWEDSLTFPDGWEE